MLTYSSTAGSLKWGEEWQICLHKSVNHKLFFQSADQCPAREKNKDHHLQAMLCPLQTDMRSFRHFDKHCTQLVVVQFFYMLRSHVENLNGALSSRIFCIPLLHWHNTRTARPRIRQRKGQTHLEPILSPLCFGRCMTSVFHPYYVRIQHNPVDTVRHIKFQLNEIYRFGKRPYHCAVLSHNASLRSSP